MPGGRDRFTIAILPEGRTIVARKQLRRVAQDGQPRVGDVEHAIGDQGAQRRQALVGHHLVERAAIAAEHDRVQARDGRHQHAHGDVGRRLQRRARLALAAAREAPRARAALAMAAVHEPAADLRVASAASPLKTPAAWPPRRTSRTPTVRSRRDVVEQRAGLVSGPLAADRGVERRERRLAHHALAVGADEGHVALGRPTSTRRSRGAPPSDPASARGAPAAARSGRRSARPRMAVLAASRQVSLSG